MFQSFSGTIGGVFAAEKKSKYFFYSSIWGAVVSVLATIAFIRFWGLQGAAIAVAFSFLVMSISRLIYAWKHINEMKLLWYILLTFLYVVFIFFVLFDLPLYINVPVYIILLMIICYMSRDVMMPVLDTIKGLIRKV